MDGRVIALTLLILAIAIVVVAVRLRRTPSVGSVELKDASGSHLTLESKLAKQLEAGGSGKPVLSISMRTVRRAGGEPAATEAITVDGQTYQSIDEIPPEVRERVRALLAKAQKPGSPSAAGNEAGLVKIEQDLMALGLDIRGPGASSEEPPSST